MTTAFILITLALGCLLAAIAVTAMPNTAKQVKRTKELINYKKVGGLHFVRIARFGFSFYIAKKQVYTQTKHVKFLDTSSPDGATAWQQRSHLHAIKQAHATSLDYTYKRTR
jgi:hypothetical protein